MKQQIIAIGGGGFGGSETTGLVERYLLKQSSATTPRICFLPQASAEDPTYIINFFSCFTELNARPTWLSLFGRVKNNIEDVLLSQDIIYVGGGNTKSMLALWQAVGIDKILKKAYEKGIILCGVSAGAICWFEECVTDSVWPLGVISGLGFLKGSCCPHYNGEPERKPAYLNFAATHTVKPGLAIEDYAAAHYVNGELVQVVSFKDNKTAYYVDAQGEHGV